MSEPPIDRPADGQLIDRQKLSAAREAMRDDLGRGRVLDKRIHREQRMMEVGFALYGLTGEWVDAEHLAGILRRLGAAVDVTDEETFARFDALLDWVLEHADDSLTETGPE